MENIYQDIFENSSICKALISLNGKIINVNGAMCEFLGMDIKELTNKFVKDVTHPDDTEVDYQYLLQLVNGKINSYQMKKRYKRKNGHYVWGLLTASIIYDNQKKPQYILGQVQPIFDESSVGIKNRSYSNREVIEQYEKVLEELTESEERYRLLIEKSPDAIIVHDGNKILLANGNAAKLYDADCSSELIGRSVHRFLYEEELENILNNFEITLNGENIPRYFENKNVTLKDEIIDVAVTAYKIRYNGKMALQAIIRNVTEKNRMDYVLQKSEKLAVVGELAAAVAHEVRNPLTSIKGFIQLFAETKEFNEKFVNITLEELKRVEEIIYEFLALAKPHKEMKYEKVNIHEFVIKKVLTLLESQALLKGIEIQTKFSDQIDEVECEANLIKQMLINIIQNGIEAINNKGKLRISTEKMKDDFIMIKVSDNGPGIPANKLSKLGEPFYSTKDKGTGLGLMTSLKIIQNHNGYVKIQSEVGKGTDFYIFLPLQQNKN